MRSRRCPTVALPRRWGLACCDATAEVRGVLRRIRRDCGCTESLRNALRGWLAVGGRPPGLMELVAQDYEILALCKGIHSKVGTGRSQIPNEAEPKPNWSLLLWSWQIEKNRLGGQGDNGDRGGHGLARLRRQRMGHITTTEQQDRRDVCTATAAR